MSLEPRGPECWTAPSTACAPGTAGAADPREDQWVAAQLGRKRRKERAKNVSGCRPVDVFVDEPLRLDSLDTSEKGRRQGAGVDVTAQLAIGNRASDHRLVCVPD